MKLRDCFMRGCDHVKDLRDFGGGKDLKVTD